MGEAPLSLRPRWATGGAEEAAAGRPKPKPPRRSGKVGSRSPARGRSVARGYLGTDTWCLPDCASLLADAKYLSAAVHRRTPCCLAPRRLPGSFLRRVGAGSERDEGNRILQGLTVMSLFIFLCHDYASTHQLEPRRTSRHETSYTDHLIPLHLISRETSYGMAIQH